MLSVRVHEWSVRAVVVAVAVLLVSGLGGGAIVHADESADARGDSADARGDSAEERSGDDDGEVSAPASRIGLLRGEEVHLALANEPRDELSVWERMRYVPLGENPYRFFGAGVDVRQRMISERAPGWVAGEDWTVWLQRYMAHVQFAPFRGFRVFVQGRSAWSVGGDAGPVDENPFDFHQVFMEVSEGTDELRITARVGRQEVSIGRHYSVREGPNVRRSHDGVRLMVGLRDAEMQGFFLRPVEVGDGVLDDRSSSAHQVAGLRVRSAPLGEAGRARLFAMVLGERRSERFVAPSIEAASSSGDAAESSALDEVRRNHVVAGVEASGSRWDAELEGAVQVGTVRREEAQDPSLLAWRVSADVGYAFDEVAGAPRLGLLADSASGDRVGSGRVGRYAPLFPRGSYYMEQSVFRPANVSALVPSVRVGLPADLELRLDAGQYWRTSTSDGIEWTSGRPLLDEGGVGTRIGTHLGTYLRWSPSAHVDLRAAWVFFRRGQWVRSQRGEGGANSNYLSVWGSFRL